MVSQKTLIIIAVIVVTIIVLSATGILKVHANASVHEYERFSHGMAACADMSNPALCESAMKACAPLNGMKVDASDPASTAAALNQMAECAECVSDLSPQEVAQLASKNGGCVPASMQDPELLASASRLAAAVPKMTNWGAMVSTNMATCKSPSLKPATQKPATMMGPPGPYRTPMQAA